MLARWFAVAKRSRWSLRPAHALIGCTAELVRTAMVESSQQKTVLHVARNLVLFNGVVTIVLATYAFWIAMPLSEIAPLFLVVLLSSIPVALPSMFTLAAAVGARALSRRIADRPVRGG